MVEPPARILFSHLKELQKNGTCEQMLVRSCEGKEARCETVRTIRSQKLLEDEEGDGAAEPRREDKQQTAQAKPELFAAGKTAVHRASAHRGGQCPVPRARLSFSQQEAHLF